MGKLTEYLRTEADTIRATKAKHKAAVDEWLAVLGGLHTDMQGWLTACDPDGLLDRSIDMIPANDPALGEYRVPVLKIGLDDRTVDVIPIARYAAARIRPVGRDEVVRAHGLVDLKGRFGVGRYVFRSPAGAWYLDSQADAPAGADYLVEPLDQDRFEAAVWALLQ